MTMTMVTMTIMLSSVCMFFIQFNTFCSVDPFSLFNCNDGGRVNGEYRRRIELLYNGEG